MSAGKEWSGWTFAVAHIGLISGFVVGVCVLDYSCPAQLLWVYTDIVEYI